MKLIVAVKRLINRFFFANRQQSNTGINAKVKQDDTERQRETLQDIIRLCKLQAGPVSED